MTEHTGNLMKSIAMIDQSIVDISEDEDVPIEEGLDLFLEYF
jgi:hypothetical protein